MANKMKTKASAATIVGPTGVSKAMERSIPVNAQETAIMADDTVTDKKLLNILIDAIAGNTISAETKSEPTNRIEIEITMAVITASIRL